MSAHLPSRLLNALLSPIQSKLIKERPPDDAAALFSTHKDTFAILRLLRSKFLSKRVYKTGLSGREFTIDVRCEGEIFGEASVLRGTPHCAWSQALRDAAVTDIRGNAFLGLMGRVPLITQRIAYLEFDKVHRAYESLIDLSASNAHQRLANLLYRLSNKYGNTLRFTQEEIAEMSGVTAETVSRVFIELKNSDIIRSTRGSVTILSEERLGSWSG